MAERVHALPRRDVVLGVLVIARPMRTKAKEGAECASAVLLLRRARLKRGEVGRRLRWRVIALTTTRRTYVLNGVQSRALLQCASSGARLNASIRSMHDREAVDWRVVVLVGVVMWSVGASRTSTLGCDDVGGRLRWRLVACAMSRRSHSLDSVKPRAKLVDRRLHRHQTRVVDGCRPSCV